MPKTDVLDIAESEDETTPEYPDPRFWCDYVNPETEVVCGAGPYDTKHQLNGHVQGKHRDRSKDKSKKSGGEDQAPKRVASTATGAAGPTTSRAAVYEQSLALAGLGLYMGVPAFDTYDLDVVNKGAPGIAAALEAVGETNKTVQRACDMVLGGGSGGAYVQLFMAALMVAAPIAANHGWVPASVGERFGSMVGAMAPPPPVSAVVPEVVPDNLGTFDPANATPDDVWNFINNVPPHVMADLAGRMMGGMEPINVTVPFDIPDGRRPDFTDTQAEEVGDGVGAAG